MNFYVVLPPYNISIPNRFFVDVIGTTLPVCEGDARIVCMNDEQVLRLKLTYPTVSIFKEI